MPVEHQDISLTRASGSFRLHAAAFGVSNRVFVNPAFAASNMQILVIEANQAMWALLLFGRSMRHLASIDLHQTAEMVYPLMDQ